MNNKIERTISDFFDVEYKNYCLSVIKDRAIPSVIDGLKPTERKIIFVSDKIWKNGNEKPMKVFQLTGKVASDSMYAHGDTSLNKTITSMGQKFKNNLPLLDGIGQYGSLRSPFAGAPRYIGTKLSKNFRMVYKDFELLKGKIEDGVEVEPDYYLPIIPMILINGSPGIAVGFATKILNRNPCDIIDACIKYLNNKKISVLKPWINEFDGEYIRDNENPKKWLIKGKYEVFKNSINITEISQDLTYEDYEKFLIELIDKKYINDYIDNTGEKVNYTIRISKNKIDELIKNNNIENFFKINNTITENFTLIDENGNLKIFDSAESILKYFVDFRLPWYQKRKDYIISKYENELIFIRNRVKFIKDIISKTIIVANKSKESIIGNLEKMGYDKINSSYNYLLDMPVYMLTKEKYNELESIELKKINELDKIKLIEIKTMYINDLNVLKKNLNNN